MKPSHLGITMVLLAFVGLVLFFGFMNEVCK